MDIQLIYNASPHNKIGKSLQLLLTVQGELKHGCNITDPVIMFEIGNVPTCNYMYIPDFGRYYFIDQIESFRNNLWNIRAHVDVLESYKTQILQQIVTLQDTTEKGADPYIMNDAFVTKVKTKTDIVNFPNGLLDDGTFILITAGGVVSI